MSERFTLKPSRHKLLDKNGNVQAVIYVEALPNGAHVLRAEGPDGEPVVMSDGREFIHITDGPPEFIADLPEDEQAT